MDLRALLSSLAGRPGLAALTVDGHGAIDTTSVSGVVADSRMVGPGSVFCCVPGARADGHDYAPAAVAAGAVALLCERPLGLGVTELRVPSVRSAMGPVAAAFHRDPSTRLDVVGVTGTNGKTTVTNLLAAVLDAAGRPCGVIGTLTGARTTPEGPALQEQLAAFAGEGRRAVAMEVSSHALVQRRVDGTWFRIAAFTNLSQDHLDYHGSMATYFQAKAMLFDAERAERAVVCVDDTHGRLLRDAASVPTVAYSVDDATDVALDARGTTFTWRGARMRVELAGRFNLANAVGAATIAAELGVEPAAVAVGLAAAGPVPGRFELVDAGQPFPVVVDYAHTPDGLAKALAAAQELVAGRVLVVFGAGGDRDASKRPLMGEAAAAGADVLVVTSDNPRSEDPYAIIEAVRSGIPDDVRPIVEPDRRAAIARAVELAGPADIVVIAGKGHETTQTTGDEVVAFDDRAVARELLQDGHQ